MPRSNRPRGTRPSGPDDGDDLAHLLTGWKRTEVRRGSEWNVQPVSAVKAVKEYICPACSLPVARGTAHLVVWRADGVLGDAADLAARRHWHTHCWRIG